MKYLLNLLLLACLGSGFTPALAGDTAKLLDALGPEKSFAMRDGSHIVIAPRVNSVRLSFENRRPVVLQAVGSGKFVSKSGQISLELEMQDAHTITAVKLSMPH